MLDVCPLGPPAFGQACNVYATVACAAVDCSYTISATSTGTSTQIFERTPVPGRVGGRTNGSFSDYYYFYNSIEGRTLLFSMTVLSGDPDIFISRTNQYPHPSDPTSFQWSAANSIGSADIVPIRNAAIGTYYIAIYPFANLAALYTLVVTAVNPNATIGAGAITLTTGQLQTDLVAAGYWRYYLYNAFGDVGIQITTGSVVGESDLYANTKSLKGNNSWPATTLGNQYTSAVTGQDLITVSTPVSSDTYYIGVYCRAFQPSGYASCSWSIAVTPLDGVLSLLSGVNVQGSLVAGQTAYYRFELVSIIPNGGDLSFLLQPQSGNPDLYISLNGRATTTFFNFSSDVSGSNNDNIVINDATRTPTGNVALRVGYYWASVYALTTTSYQIMASYAARIRLIDGVVMSGLFSFLGDVQYYDIIIPYGMGFSVSVIPLGIGGVNVYINMCNGNVQICQPTLSTLDSAQYKAVNTNLNYLTVFVPASACNIAMGCRFIILIVPSASSLSYQIVASTTNGTGTLTPGVATPGNVVRGGYRFYQFTNTIPNINITISVTPSSGDPDLYVKKGNLTTGDIFPTTADNQWASENGAGQGDVAIIRFNDAKLGTTGIVGRYLISVVGYTASTFIITLSFLIPVTPPPVVVPTSVVVVPGYSTAGAATSTAPIFVGPIPITLFQNTPINGVVGPAQYAYYSYQINVDVPIVFTLTLTEIVAGANPDIYVRLAGNRNIQNSYPYVGQGTLGWSSTQTGATQDVITLNDNSIPIKCNVTTAINGICNYWIGVYGAGTAASQRFIITAGPASSSNYLVINPGGAGTLGAVAQSSWVYYIYRVSSIPRYITAILIPTEANTNTSVPFLCTR